MRVAMTSYPVESRSFSTTYAHPKKKNGLTVGFGRLNVTSAGCWRSESFILGSRRNDEDAFSSPPSTVVLFFSLSFPALLPPHVVFLPLHYLVQVSDTKIQGTCNDDSWSTSFPSKSSWLFTHWNSCSTVSPIILKIDLFMRVLVTLCLSSRR